MKTRNLMLLTASLFLLVVGASQAWAADRGYTMPDRIAAWHASQMSWHDNYQHWQWGRPLPLVVPHVGRVGNDHGKGPLPGQGLQAVAPDKVDPVLDAVPAGVLGRKLERGGRQVRCQHTCVGDFQGHAHREHS